MNLSVSGNLLVWGALGLSVSGDVLLYSGSSARLVEKPPTFPLVTHEWCPFPRSGVFPVIRQTLGASSLSREVLKFTKFCLCTWVCFRGKVISSIDSEDDCYSVYCLIPLPVCKDADTSVHHLVTALLFYKTAVKPSLLSRISLCTEPLNRALETCYCSWLCSCSWSISGWQEDFWFHFYMVAFCSKGLRVHTCMQIVGKKSDASV